MEKTRKKLWIAFAGIFAVIACFLLFNPNTVKNTYAAADANITNQTGLGLGINVVTAESFNDFKLSYMVFDDEALQALPKSSFRAKGFSNLRQTFRAFSLTSTPTIC